MEVGNKDMKFSVEIDNHEGIAWDNVVSKFDDATIYQTSAYGEVRWGKSNLSRMVLKRDDKVVAAAQVRILKLPLLGPSLAYIGCGPILQRRNAVPDCDDIRFFLSSIKNEYVLNRGCLLKIEPKYFDYGNLELSDILHEEGFQLDKNALAYNTFIIDLSQSLDEIMKSLHKKWREKLRRGQRSCMHVISGYFTDYFDVFKKLYMEMMSRKKFVQYVDIDEFFDMQKKLPREMQLRIMICHCDGAAVSALVWTSIGKTGIPLFSATGQAGLKAYGAYLLRWRLVETLKSQGCRYFDQAGVDPVSNPGGYLFKSGLGGEEVKMLRQYYASSNSPLSSLLVFGFNFRNNLKRVRRIINVRRHSKSLFRLKKSL